MNAMELKLWMLYCIVLFAGRGKTDPVIRECLSGKRTVTEDTDVSFNCDPYSNGLDWGFLPSYYFAYCEQTQCHPSLGYLYSLQATSIGQHQYSSQLTIKNITRYQARDFVCYDRQSGKRSTCKLRVTVPGRLVNGSCSLQLLRWYVQGSCRFTKMYDSDNNYTCVWRKNNDELLTEIKRRESYTASYGRQYVRGSCFYNQSIPTETGTYRYSVSTSTGAVDLFTTSISIMVPGLPSHDCPQTVPEASDITCTCRSQVIGNPPARVVWDGLNTNTLALHNVRRENNSLVYMCRLTWGPDDVIYRNVSYVVRVTYEPSDADIESTTQAKGNGTDIFPLVNHTTIAVHNSSTVYVPNIKESSQLHTSVSSESVSKGLIGGVVAAVIIIIIIAVLVIVYIIKRRKGTICKETGALPFVHKLFQSNSAPSKAEPFVHKPKDQPLLQRHAAPSGDLYTIASTTTTAGQVGDDYASVCKMVENDVYEPEGDVRLQASPAGHEMNRSGDKETPTVKPKPAKVTMTSVFSVSGTGYANVTEVPTDSGLGVYHIVPWRVPSDRTPFACDTSAPGNCEDEYNVLKYDDGSVHYDPGDSYNHLQIT